jgi:CheY-like chemotaxis protein
MERADFVILQLENDENDVLLLQAASRGADYLVRSVPDGYEAIHYLRGEGRYQDRTSFPIPSLLLCDFKMPRLDGFGFLRWIRSDREYWVTPVIMCTGSALDADIREAYRLGANSVVAKPEGLEGLVKLLRALYAFWSLSECPPMPVSHKAPTGQIAV